MADIFCTEDQDEFVQKDCGIDEAGLVATAYIKRSVITTQFAGLTRAQKRELLESEAFWNAGLAASPTDIFIATKTRGEYPGGTPTEEDGFGRESTQITGATHEMTTEFEGLDENQLFVEGINRRKWAVVAVTNGDKGIFIEEPVTVYGKPNVPRGITTGAFYMISHKWQDYSNPIIFDIPAGIFDE
jgi:hypothetical protein